MIRAFSLLQQSLSPALQQSFGIKSFLTKSIFVFYLTNLTGVARGCGGEEFSRWEMEAGHVRHIKGREM